MYYPYLRGKQNELFAIRELLEKGLIGDLRALFGMLFA